MKKKLMSVISVVLVLCLMFSALPFAAAAETTRNDQTPTQKPTIRDDVSIESDGSVGSMFADALEQKLDSTEKNNGISISSVEFEGAVATANYSTVLDATLLVGIYSDDGTEMYASGTAPAVVNEQSVEVTIDIEEMPQYFYIKAFIIDPVNNKPLCQMYESPMYTERMARFFEKTTDDFPQEKVINFDDDKTNNFAVIDPSNPYYFQCGNEANKLVFADGSTHTYIFENMDNSVVPVPGSVFAFRSGEVLYAAKATSVSKDNGTVTIQGTKAALDEVFSYVKIDTEGDLDKATYSPEGKSDGVTLVDPEQESTDHKESEPVGKAESTYYHDKKSICLNIAHEFGEEPLTCKIEGSLDLFMTVKMKLFVDWDVKFIEFSIEYGTLATISISAKIEEVIKLGNIIFTPVPGVSIKLNPGLVLECEVELSFTVRTSSVIGFRAYEDGRYQNISQNPKTEVDGNISVTIFLGFQLKPEIEILWGLVSLAFEARAGVELEASISWGYSSGDVPDEDVVHTCDRCVEGTLSAKYSFSVEVGFLWAKCLTFKFKIAEQKFKITDFYFSYDHQQFGFGTCPYQTYVSKIIVVDEDNNPIKNVLVNGQYITDSNGTVRIPLNDGLQNINVSYGLFTVSKEIRVEGEPKTQLVTIPGKLGSGVSGGLVKQVKEYYNSKGALLRDGSLYLWGQELPHQNSFEVNETPKKVMDDVKSFDIYQYRCAAIKNDGSLYTWGDGYCGKLGNGLDEYCETPTKILSNVRYVDLAFAQSAAITEDGELYLWGSNMSHWFGDNDGHAAISSTVPIKFIDRIKSVSLGWNHGAAITYEGDLYTWGMNNEGQLGNGTNNETIRPVKIMENVKSVSCSKSGFATAAVTEDGTLYAWGKNYNKILGADISPGASVSRPVKIATFIKSASLSDPSSAFYITNGGSMYLWGDTLNTPDQNNQYTRYIINEVLQASHGLILRTNDSVLEYDTDFYGWDYNAQSLMNFEEIKFHSHNISESVGSRPSRTVTMTGYQPNCVYNFYAVKSADAEYVLSNDNLLYIDQVVTDENGDVTVNYIPSQECKTPYVFMETFGAPHISRVTIDAPACAYNGEEQTWSPVLSCGDYRLQQGVDYEISGTTSATDAGNYMIKLTGKGRFRGNMTRYFVINPKDIISAVCSVSDQQYSGKPLTPVPTVTIDGKTLEKDRDYTVTYDNNTTPGEATVTVEGIGNYKGRLTAGFRISGSAFITGDANGDGLISVRDVTEIQKHLAQLITLTGDALTAADTNGDGSVTVSDVTHLQKFLAEYEVVLGKQ